jgi:hypothetical protein
MPGYADLQHSRAAKAQASRMLIESKDRPSRTPRSRLGTRRFQLEQEATQREAELSSRLSHRSSRSNLSDREADLIARLDAAAQHAHPASAFGATFAHEDAIKHTRREAKLARARRISDSSSIPAAAIPPRAQPALSADQALELPDGLAPPSAFSRALSGFNRDTLERLFSKARQRDSDDALLPVERRLTAQVEREVGSLRQQIATLTRNDPNLIAALVKPSSTSAPIEAGNITPPAPTWANSAATAEPYLSLSAPITPQVTTRSSGAPHARAADQRRVSGRLAGSASSSYRSLAGYPEATLSPQSAAAQVIERMMDPTDIPGQRRQLSSRRAQLLRDRESLRTAVRSARTLLVPAEVNAASIPPSRNLGSLALPPSATTVPHEAVARASSAYSRQVALAGRIRGAQTSFAATS